MSNALEFSVFDNTHLIGWESVSPSCSLWLGAAPLVGGITAALRQFNLPNAVAPFEWPRPGSGVGPLNIGRGA